MRGPVIASLLLLCAASGAFAADPPARRSWSWQATINATADQGASGTVSLDGRWTTGFLLGEPVVNCTARVRGEPLLRVGLTGDGASRLVSAGAGEVEIYNVVVVAMMDAPGAPTWNGSSSSKWMVFCDAGIVAQQGRNGFNVAGSPDWDRFFCEATWIGGVPKRRDDAEDSCAAAGGKWVAPDRARQFARTGLDFKAFAIFDFALNTSATVRRVEKEDWRRRSARFKRERAQSLVEGLRDGSVEGAMRGVEASRRLPALPELPDAGQLEAFGKALYALELEFAGAAHREAWSPREKDLVAAQLQHLARVEPAVRRDDARLAAYRRQLEVAAASAPEMADPLADALAMDVETFTENGLRGVRLPDGQVLTAPTYAATCGSHKGVVCIKDANGREALVDAYGERLLDFQDHDIRLEPMALTCAGSVVLRRSEREDRLDTQYALYSLVTQRQTWGWQQARSWRARGDACDEGFLVELSSSVVDMRRCKYTITERVHDYFGFDGSVIARDQRVRESNPDYCVLSSHPAGGP